MDDDDNEMFGFYDWLTDKGYESYGCNYYPNGVMVEEGPEMESTSTIKGPLKLEAMHPPYVCRCL